MMLVTSALNSGLSGRQERSILASSVIASEEEAVFGDGSIPLVGCL